MENATASAHQEWDRTWRTREGRADWLVPESDILRVLPALHKRTVRRVLDLGCGVGRHSYLFASEGFEVTALDRSANGLDFLRQEGVKQNLAIDTVNGEMTALPFDDESFDYILAWNVIYHGNKQVVQRAIGEIHRVLKPGGYFQGTMLSTRHFETRIGQWVSEGTYIQPGPTEKAYPHYYCDEKTLIDHYHDFTFLERLEKEHKLPESFHWHLLLARSG